MRLNNCKNIIISLQFNCPNSKRLRNVKMISRLEDNDDKPSATVKRIHKLENFDDFQKVRKNYQENAIIKKKNNIIDFYIKTNDNEEERVRVLIDSGMDLNFILQYFANEDKNSFVLGYCANHCNNEGEEEYIKGRKVRKINDSDSYSNINDYFMLNSDYEYFNNNDNYSYKKCKLCNSCNKNSFN
eukprot:jgi/Orpsp1_1/1175134/evm.model.c7180000052747.2